MNTDSPDLHQQRRALEALIEQEGELTPRHLQAALRRFPRRDGGLFGRVELGRAYQALCAAGEMASDPRLERLLHRKPTRTISGVAPVTVLTPPHPCRGRCLYCPNVPDAPVSYLPDEPGVQRAIRFGYDPYAQTAGRIRALHNIGHPTDKVELLILGGTWSDYDPADQARFVQRCLEAMNGQPAASLEEAQRQNESAPHRNVGITVETRPDCISDEEIRRLRRLGVTRVQLGVQSLDDRILALVRRGHGVTETRAAVRRLRCAGFKIVLHWMPNLPGATPASDLADFERLWDDPALRPDELKVYPCLLLEGTGLYRMWQEGQYQPYDEPTLIELLIECKRRIPPYCRLNRLMRDIPAPDIVAGVARSNLRQVVQRAMAARGLRCRCIRCREVRETAVEMSALRLGDLVYETSDTVEHFLTFETEEGRLAALLRLSLPQGDVELEELRGSAVVRELHVYGTALELGERQAGRPQHGGLGTRLLEEARAIARQAGFGRLAVIAAVGTRPYYRERGFELGELYMSCDLS